MMIILRSASFQRKVLEILKDFLSHNLCSKYANAWNWKKNNKAKTEKQIFWGRPIRGILKSSRANQESDLF